MTVNLITLDLPLSQLNLAFDNDLVDKAVLTHCYNTLMD